MKNKISLIGFLGLLGILGYFTNNPGLYGFFGFFGFFGYNRVIQDELFKIDLGKSALVAFYTFIIGFAITFSLSLILQNESYFMYGFIATFGVSVFLFSLTLILLNRSGKTE